MRTILASVGMLGALFGCSAARAAIVTGDTITISQNSVAGSSNFYTTAQLINSGTNGGEFLITKAGSPADTFKTFCIEKNEFIALPHAYVVEISNSANGGGVGLTDPLTGIVSTGSDPLSQVTKQLYGGYRNNAIVGVGGFNYSTVPSLADLQNAIWYLENEVPATGLSSGANALVSWAANKVSANGGLSEYDVRVMRLWDNYNSSTGVWSGYHQDQLYYVGTSNAGGVPEPVTLVIWSALAGAGSIYGLRRRRV